MSPATWTSLADAGLLVLMTALFSATVFTYFLVSDFFQSQNRQTPRSGDGIAFLVAGVLLVVFTASYLEIFIAALRLPYPPYADLTIGIIAVTAAVTAAYGISAYRLRQRTRRLQDGHPA